MLEARHGYIKWENCKVTFNTILKKKKGKTLNDFLFYIEKDYYFRGIILRFFDSIFLLNYRLRLLANIMWIPIDANHPVQTDRLLFIKETRKKREEPGVQAGPTYSSSTFHHKWKHAVESCASRYASRSFCFLLLKYAEESVLLRVCTSAGHTFNGPRLIRWCQVIRCVSTTPAARDQCHSY